MIRPARPADHDAIGALNDLAFQGSPLERAATDAVRAACPDEVIELVADVDGRLVGHIILHPGIIERTAGGVLQGFGLGPVSVTPGLQRGGIGGRLLASALDEARKRGAPFIFLIGHPEYYPRFGFERASAFGLASPYPDAPDEAWMVCPLDREALKDAAGEARYHPAFDAAVSGEPGGG